MVAIGFPMLSPDVMTYSDTYLGWSAGGVGMWGDYHIGSAKSDSCSSGGVCVDAQNNVLSSRCV